MNLNFRSKYVLGIIEQPQPILECSAANTTRLVEPRIHRSDRFEHQEADRLPEHIRVVLPLQDGHPGREADQAGATNRLCGGQSEQRRALELDAKHRGTIISNLNCC
jgi:hypothetical protein